MSGHCKGCGVYHEEDDGRLCGRCVAPFAVVEDECNVRFETNADHTECIRCVCLHECGDEEAVDAVADINAAVAARERKAAAQALREAADTVLDTHDGPAFRMIGSLDDGTENRRMFRDWLRAYADSVEKGER